MNSERSSFRGSNEPLSVYTQAPMTKVTSMTYMWQDTSRNDRPTWPVKHTPEAWCSVAKKLLWMHWSYRMAANMARKVALTKGRSGIAASNGQESSCECTMAVSSSRIATVWPGKQLYWTYTPNPAASQIGMAISYVWMHFSSLHSKAYPEWPSMWLGKQQLHDAL